MNSAKCCTYYSTSNFHKSRSFRTIAIISVPYMNLLHTVQASVSILTLNVIKIMEMLLVRIITLLSFLMWRHWAYVFSDITSSSESVLSYFQGQNHIPWRGKYFHCIKIPPPPPQQRSMGKNTLL